VARLKQTPEEEAKEEDEKDARTEDILQKGKELTVSASKTATQVWSVSKGPLKMLAIVITGFIVIVIAYTAYVVIGEFNRLAEVKQMEAEESKNAAAQAAQEHRLRVDYLKQVMNSGAISGYAFGENNSKQISGILGGGRYDNGRIECDESDCRSLLNDNSMVSAIKSIQLNYCSGLNGDLLTKVVFFYKKESDASIDFESIKSESLISRKVDADISRQMNLMPYVINISQKRGEWDVCGSQ